MYIPSLHKLQVGLEAAVGDGAATTIQPAGITNFRIDPKVEVEQIKDKRGSTMPAVDAFVKRRWSEGVIEGMVDFNRAYIWFDGMFGKATPVGDDRTYLGSLDWAAEVEQSLSLKYGQTDLIYHAAGVLPKELKISGASGEPWKFSYNFFGRSATDGASFAALSDDVPEWCKGAHTTVYIDEGLDATAGDTPMTNIGFRFEATITCEREPVWHLGNQEWDAYKRGKWGGSLSLVLEADATMLAALGDILDATVTPMSYAVRIEGDDGTNVIQLDFVGTVVIPPTLIQDSDGIVTVELALAPQYGSDLLSCWGGLVTIA
jgi:hypothetical protein